MKLKPECAFSNDQQDASSYQPVFFKISSDLERQKFYDFQKNQSFLFLFDEVKDQIEALIKYQSPSLKLSSEQMSAAYCLYLANRQLDEIGVWVYYPWSGRLVHLLDEKEFVELRTNRNKYKITSEEQTLLAGKKIGVIGLSVGQAAALTLTMERGYGEIRLADFDALDITNLNRLRTGVHNLGISKVILAAREIAEIDPFLKVVCFTDGITEENIDAFFLDGGKLDLLVEECDGLDIKILCRQKAKALGVPVVMEASDRGTIDIERFDLEPDREILHGLIKGLEIDNIKVLTNEEKIPFLLPMVGVNTMSTRLKASLFEVEQTINTWPQLGSAIALGGALVADVCRRIFLNEFTSSGRYHVDIEEIVGDEKKHLSPSKLLEKENLCINEAFMLRSIEINGFEKDHRQLELPELIRKLLIEAATRAPSGGNNQPWQWYYHEKTIYLFCDRKQKNNSFLDFNGAASFIALGAATENLVLKAHALGMEVTFEKKVSDDPDSFIGAFRFYPNGSNKLRWLEPHICDFLAAFIEERHTNRNLRPRKKLPNNKLDALVSSINSIEGIQLTLVESFDKIQALANIIGKIDKLRLFHDKGHAEFMDELRWTSAEAEEKKDGIYLGAIDLSPSEKAGLELAKDWDAIHYLNQIGGGNSLERTSRKCIGAAAAIGLISSTGSCLNDFFEGGRALQRIWLTASQNKIAFHPLTAATFIFHILKDQNCNAFSPAMAHELTLLSNALQGIFPQLTTKTGLFIFRIFEEDCAPTERSMRYPIEKVFR